MEVPAPPANRYCLEMLTRLLLYGYASGVNRSRGIEKATYDVLRRDA